MLKTQFKSKRKKVSPKQLLLTSAALIAALVMLASIISVAKKYFEVKRYITELNTEQSTLKQKYQNLVKNNDYLATPDGEEQVLRDKYNMVRPGEGLIIITDSSSNEIPVEKTSRLTKWWQSLINLFKKDKNSSLQKND